MVTTLSSGIAAEAMTSDQQYLWLGACTSGCGVLQRIDICWSVAPVLGMVDIIRGADFQARCLLMTLDAGEPYRVARALAAEACSAATESKSCSM